MQSPPFESPRVLGRTGLAVGAIGLGSSYGVGGSDIERAFERGVRLFLWGSRRRPKFAAGIRALAPRRDELVLGIQSYSRVGSLMKPFVTKALKSLGTDHVDLLGLAWWNDSPSRRILDAAMKLRDQGLVRHLMVSCHHRPSFQTFLGEPAYAAWMLRYNAAHPGAEREVFPHLGDPRPGVLAFTATRWGKLTSTELTPPGERTPSATDCYRFVLSSPDVDATLCGPSDGKRLDESMAALDQGPMSAEELAWMRRVGVAVRANAKAGGPIHVIDKLAARMSGRAAHGARDA